MTSPGDVFAYGVLGVGCLVLVVSACALLWTGPLYEKVHLLGPVTSLGAPLICLALMLENGWSLATAQIALIGVLLALTGPVVAMAAGRVQRQREQGDYQEAPE